MSPKSFFILISSLCLTAGCAKTPTSPGLAAGWVETTGSAFSNGRYGMAGAVFNNKMWVIGGASGLITGSSAVTTFYSDVYSSSDGSDWSKTSGPFGARYGSQLVVFNNALYLIGGNKTGTLMNDIWTSTDGSNWTQVVTNNPIFSAREDFGAMVWNGAIWVYGGWSGSTTGTTANTSGCLNDVWTSTDGVNWARVAANPTFRASWGFGTTLFNGELWNFGGATAGPLPAQGDDIPSVYASNGGGTVWTLESSMSYDSYYNRAVVGADGNIYVTGGYSMIQYAVEPIIATSADGVNWTEQDGRFGSRCAHVSLSFDNEVWVIGGLSYGTTTSGSGDPETAPIYLNDVWHGPTL